jgi:hypothetical protein
MCFSYVHEFDLQSLKQLLTCNIKSSKLKYIYIYIYIWLVSWFQQYHCQIVIYGVIQCMWKRKIITLQFHKCSKKTKPILFSHYYKSKKVHTHTYTHIKRCTHSAHKTTSTIKFQLQLPNYIWNYLLNHF